jgi:hypothetical protein
MSEQDPPQDDCDIVAAMILDRFHQDLVRQIARWLRKSKERPTASEDELEIWFDVSLCTRGDDLVEIGRAQGSLGVSPRALEEE